MSQYGSDFEKYMQGQGKGGAGDYQKYMSDFQQYMKGQGGSVPPIVCVCVCVCARVARHLCNVLLC